MDSIQPWDFPKYIVRQELIDTRGWTAELIDKFLTPDLVETNPHNHNQQMRLYLKERVFETERTARFQTMVLRLCEGKVDSYQFLQIKRQHEIDSKHRKRNHLNALGRIKSRQRPLLNSPSSPRISQDQMRALADLGLV